MMTLIDTNVLLDHALADPEWADWSMEQIRVARRQGELSINPIIYAELSAGAGAREEVETLLDDLEVKRLSLPYEAAYLAGKAFAAYRKRGGEKRSPLPDFYIGAHAEYLGLTLLTRDPARYRTYFPDLHLIAPDA